MLNPTTKLHYTLAVIRVLLKVCEAYQCERDSPAYSILAEFLSGRCAEFHMLLKEYIAVLSLDDKNPSGNFKKIHSLFSHLMICLPSSSWCTLPIDDLVEALQYHNFDGKLCSDILMLKTQRDDIRSQYTKTKEDTDSMDDWDYSEYRRLPILPTMDEICISTPPQLRSNLIHGAYMGWEHYYDTHFRLLREDFIAPLRRGVSEFRQVQRTRHFLDVNVYTGVQLLEPEFTYDGLCYKVSFDTSRFRHRRSWAHSKRLIFGSLLCFTPQYDQFNEESYFASVIQRDPEKLKKGIFHVQFEDGLQLFHHLNKTIFIAIESKAYFEASRHILRSLQTAEVETMPFKKYLIENNPTPVQQPQYLQGISPVYDLRWLYPSDNRCTQRNPFSLDDLLVEMSKFEIDITDDHQWPNTDEVELDESQVSAIKMALTQEIAVIQGPPGTGKTYIGYKIVQTLLQNRKSWDPNLTSPILVMCYTNHALDQFLEGIIHHRIMENSHRIPKIVRVGSRSQSEEIQQYSLHNVKKELVPSHRLFHLYKCKEDIDEAAKSIPWKSLQNMMQDPVNENIVSPNGLLLLRSFISPSHLYQLLELVDDQKLKLHSLAIWLGLWEKEDSQSTAINDSEKAYTNIKPEDNAEQFQELEATEVNEEDFVDVVGEAEHEEAARKLDDESHHQIETAGIFHQEMHADALTEYMMADKQEKNLEVQHDQMPDDANTPKYKMKNELEVKKLLNQIRHCEPLEPELEVTIDEISELEMQDRWKLFKLWIHKYQMFLNNKSHVQLGHYVNACHEYKRIQQELDRIALEKVEVIGMTTTGAAKYQHILHLVKPKIVIVEEAAEVLESHIVSALNAGTQHLILIGDHKQLRPKPNEYDLAKKHHLDISLFERLIHNGLPHATLLIQHRMRPQIANLVCPFVYSKLVNHESVLDYDDIRGFDKNMFFFQHDHPEEEDEHLMSHSNEYEATFVVELCRHLLKQNYEPSQITILTAYTGQLLKVRALMPKDVFDGVRVVNVDNFQGEENDIIILSLVRSNAFDNVGFLRDENRVCVALSRAKMGFYCFGNFEMLRRVVPLWQVILSHIEKESCLGISFQLYCHNHPKRKFEIKEPDDFLKYCPEGGCTEQCQYRLDCGHQCRLSCHLVDPDHEEYDCKQPCSKYCLTTEHPCAGYCFQPCPPCRVLVLKVIPSCGHEQIMFCCENPRIVQCISPCSKFCSNGLHICPLKCWEQCKQCTILVKRKKPNCVHEQEMECYKKPEHEKCLYPCAKTCPSSHACPKLCWEDCGQCQIILKKQMPLCKHIQRMPCYMNPIDFKCQRMCSKIYDCRHPCPKKCHESCDVFCLKQVEKFIPHCGHLEIMPCHMDPERWKCGRPCQRWLDCGHNCKQLCGEQCLSSLCQEPVYMTLTCQHKVTVKCNNFTKTSTLVLQPCRQQCLKLLPCGHNCKNICSEPCTSKCEAKVPYICPKGHKQALYCHETQDPEQNCAVKCTIIVSKNCRCGHKHKMRCCDSFDQCSCPEKCPVILECGHKCSGKCGDCFRTRIHPLCIYDVQINRVCGHFGSAQCMGMYEQCRKPCQLAICPHVKEPCAHKCGEECLSECSEPCISACPHGKCTKRCNEVCNCSPCGKPCTKVLKCRHYCPGLCGEKCLSICMNCSPKKFRESVKGLGKKAKLEGRRYIELQCGHIFTIEYLDKFVRSESGVDYRITPLYCPACSKPMVSSYYWKTIQERLHDITEIQQLTSRATEHYIPSNIKDVVMRIIYHHIPQRKLLFPNVQFEETEETMCAMKLIQQAGVLADQEQRSRYELLKPFQARDLLKTIVSIIVSKKVKLSPQLLTDVQSELYRINLIMLLEKVSCITTDRLKGMLGPVKSALHQMQEDPRLRLTESKYHEYLTILQYTFEQKTGTALKNIVSLEINLPEISKGEWYKCRRAGHFYFVPSKYRNKKETSLLQCPKCMKTK